MIYVCDRADDRIEVFTKTGSSLVRIIPVVPGTGADAGHRRRGRAWYRRLGMGSALHQRRDADVHSSRSTAATRSCTRWIACAGTIVSDMGQPGHEPGQFTYLHSNTVDSKGNIYTGETINGRRIQKFVRVECNKAKARATARVIATTETNAGRQLRLTGPDRAPRTG